MGRSKLEYRGKPKSEHNLARANAAVDARKAEKGQSASSSSSSSIVAKRDYDGVDDVCDYEEGEEGGDYEDGDDAESEYNSSLILKDAVHVLTLSSDIPVDDTVCEDSANENIRGNSDWGMLINELQNKSLQEVLRVTSDEDFVLFGRRSDRVATFNYVKPSSKEKLAAETLSLPSDAGTNARAETETEVLEAVSQIEEEDSWLDDMIFS